MKPEEQLQAQIQTATAPKDAVRDQDKIMLVLCYLGILALIPLLTVNDSEFVKWHAKNGLVFGLTATIVIVLLQFIWLLGQFLSCLGIVAFLVVTVMAIGKAMKGERWRIPLVTALAERL
jgi:uncharacterized membrane protein